MHEISLRYERLQKHKMSAAHGANPRLELMAADPLAGTEAFGNRDQKLFANAALSSIVT